MGVFGLLAYPCSITLVTGIEASGGHGRVTPLGCLAPKGELRFPPSAPPAPFNSTGMFLCLWTCIIMRSEGQLYIIVMGFVSYAMLSGYAIEFCSLCHVLSIIIVFVIAITRTVSFPKSRQCRHENFTKSSKCYVNTVPHHHIFDLFKCEGI